MKDWTSLGGFGHLVFHLAVTFLLIVVAGAALLLPIWQDKNGSRLVTGRTFEVRSIVDGDTFKIVYEGKLTSLRVNGIDAPEPNTPEGAAATAALAKLIQGKLVRIEFPGPRKRDDSGRLLCDVHVEGDVGAEMIRQGHAKPYVPSR